MWYVIKFNPGKFHQNFISRTVIDESFYNVLCARAAERTRGARGKILFGAPMTSYFYLKTRGQYPKAFRIPVNGAFNAF